MYAPTLVEYVEWVLQEAVSAGIRRLYFLARDGYMMYRTALAIAERRRLAIEIRYLKVSRYAVRRAEYYFLGKKALDTICVGGIDADFSKLMKRAALTGEEAHHIARLCGMEERFCEPLDYRQIQRLKKDLSELQILPAYIKKHSREAYENAVDYLRKELLFEDLPCAVADSGWIGSLQLSLQNVIEHASGRKKRLTGYYFGMYERPEGTDRAQYQPFYFGEKDIRRKVYFSNCLFETVFSAPEGMTLGYEKGEAVESGHKNPNGETIARFAREMERYTEAYLGGKADDPRTAEAPGRAQRGRFVEKLLIPMMGHPTEEEAAAFGNLLFCDDVLELNLQPVAAKWEESEPRKQRFLNRLLVKSGYKKETLHESAWTEGTITNLKGNVERNMRQERWYKRFLYFRKAICK